MLRWYDSLLKNLPNGIAQEEPVRIFILGKNIWREEDDWPLARAKITRYYLVSSGEANTMAGSGTWTARPPVAENSRDTFAYNPANAVPTQRRSPLLRFESTNGWPCGPTRRGNKK